MSMKMISIAIQRLGGDTLQWDMETASTIAVLKYFVFESWGIPPPYQKLFLDGKEVAAAETTLEEVLPSDTEVLTFFLFVSSTEVVRKLDSADEGEVEEALILLAQFGLESEEVAIDMIIPLLAHSSIYVRFAVAETLGSFIGKGNLRAVNGVLKILKEVRHNPCALYALRDVAECGDQVALKAVMRTLRDYDAMWSSSANNSDSTLREIVLTTLATLSLDIGVFIRGVEPIAPKLEFGTNGSIDPVLQDFLNALNIVASKDHGAAIRALAALFRDVCENMQRFARHAIASLVEEGDPFAIGVVIEYLDSSEHAVAALGDIAQSADEFAFTAFLQVQVDPAWPPCKRKSFVLALLQAMVFMASIGDERALSVAIGFLMNEEDDGVREAALQVLCALAPKGDAKIIDVVFECIVEGHGANVCSAAFETLSAIIVPGHQHTIEKILALIDSRVDQISRLKQLEMRIRTGCLELLASVSQPGNDKVISAILARVTHSDSQVREAALKALALLATRGDQRVIVAAHAALLDHQLGVRRAAFGVLTAVEAA